MLTSVRHASKVKNFVLRLTFSDGSVGEHDFASLVAKNGSMVVPLRDPAYFDRFFVDNGALTWPNGFDLDPINLHDQMQAAGELRQLAAE